MGFHRADCLAALVAKLPSSCQVSFSKRLTSYSQDGSEIEIAFRDGSTAKCDILIGADGYKSVTRECMLQEKARTTSSEEEGVEILSGIDPVWSGDIAYRAVIPTEKIRTLAPTTLP